MDRLAKAIKHVSGVSSRNDKERLLREYSVIPGFKEALKFIYNPYIHTGIAKAKLAKRTLSYQLGTDCSIVTLSEAIGYFTNHQTGSDTDVWTAWVFINAQQTVDAKWLAEALVTKNLKIGVTATTLNKVYGVDFIPRIGIMQGHSYKDYKGKVNGPFIVTEKFDGHRRILVKENGKCTFYTRSGHIDSGLVDVEAELQYLPDNMMYDSEFLAIGKFENSIDLRQATSSIMNSDGIRHGVTMNVFDMVPIEEFKSGRCQDGALDRKILLGVTLRDVSIMPLLRHTKRSNELLNRTINSYIFQYIRPVKILGIATTEEEILAFAEPIWERGFEGVMLNTLDGKYEIKRSNQLLKVKHTEEHTLTVIDIAEGEGRLTGTLGKLIVDYKGNRVGVGSGFSDPLRAKLWHTPLKDTIGKRIEIDTFGESKDKSGNVSLNCPIFKRFVGGD